MQSCADLCALPERFDTLTLDEQARLILECRIRDIAAFRLCAERHKALAEWVRRN